MKNKEKVSSFYKEAVVSADVGLRRYMLGVFAHMSAGLALTAFAAVFTVYCPGLGAFALTFNLPIALIGLVLVFRLSYSAMKPDTTASKARTMFLVYAVLMGVMLAPVFMFHSGENIAEAFFVNSSMFLSMVLYGYTTDKDLSSWGSLLFMALIGLIIAQIVNIFMQSSGLMLATSAIGVVIFVALTAYDIQIIKNAYWEDDSPETGEKKSVLGALRLYLDFINLFLYILRFMRYFSKK
ncbi:MAG: Bax inhibitor-1/YccA family protein [Holosporaceae bacterium]|jgi:FtsH-binding integral membrane protein|nr:Bax inhibitor-1/YccA family protein [Holosporaceae bacterium]